MEIFTKLHSAACLYFTYDFAVLHGIVTHQMLFYISFYEKKNVGHIRIALWFSGSSGSTGVTHFQPCSVQYAYQITTGVYIASHWLVYEIMTACHYKGWTVTIMTVIITY